MQPTVPPTRVIRRPDVIRKTGLSRTTLFNLEAAGDFPARFLLTPRCAVWNEAEIDAWIASRRVAPAASAPWPDVSLRRSSPGRGKAAR